MTIHHFTPWASLAGGVLIGLAASLLLIGSGRIAGISGILGGILSPARGDVGWRVAFLGGLLTAGLVGWLLSPSLVGPAPGSVATVALAGVLVGAGTRLGNGCTSGHGVCGLSRLSPRSLVATLSFMATGIATVLVVRLLGGSS